MATEEEALRLVAILETRRGGSERHVAYYKSEQPLKFASDTFAKNFGKQYEGFSDNWCQVVADSPVERLTVTGVKAAGAEKADDELWAVYQANQLDCDSQLGFLGCYARRPGAPAVPKHALVGLYPLPAKYRGPHELSGQA